MPDKAHGNDDPFGHVRAFMLDWDGTLIDSLPLKIRNAGRLFAERFGTHPDDVCASYARHSGVPRRVLFDRIAADTIGRTLGEDEFDALSDAFSAGNRQTVVELGILREGTLDALRALRAAGRRLFVSTSAAPPEVEPLARHFGVAALVDGVFGSRPGFGKGPEHVAHVCEAYGFERDEMAGVGDDVSDLRLFRASGILPVGITGTETADVLREHGAAYVVDALAEVVPRSDATGENS